MSFTMTATQEANFTFPALPQGWGAGKNSKLLGTLSSATQRNIEPVGPHFLAHARRVNIVQFELPGLILLSFSVETSSPDIF
jgi:hypothetical protein